MDWINDKEYKNLRESQLYFREKIDNLEQELKCLHAAQKAIDRVIEEAEKARVERDNNYKGSEKQSTENDAQCHDCKLYYPSDMLREVDFCRHNGDYNIVCPSCIKKRNEKGRR